MPTYKFAGINALSDPAAIDFLNPKSDQYGQCVDLVNVDLDDEDNMLRREGSTLVLPVEATSGSGLGFLVVAGRINFFDGTTLTVLDDTLEVLPDCEFEKCNTVTVFSDGQVIGIIDNGIVTRIDRPSDWVDAAEIMDWWLATHAPADPANWDGFNSNSNFEVDAFKLPTQAGRCLHFYNGTLYLAINNFIFATKTFDLEHMDIRYCVIAGFHDNVTGISHVNGALYVGTDGGAYFLPGGGVVVEDGKVIGSFEQRKVNEAPAIRGTFLRLSAIMLPKSQAQGVCVMWATPQGVMMGTETGQVVNLMEDTMLLPVVAQGSALFRFVGGKRQYVVCLGDQVFIVNTTSYRPCRYTDYQFTSIFALGDHQYGTHTTGIYRLEGKTDAHRDGAQIDAYSLHPVTTFGKRQVKYITNSYITAYAEGALRVDYIVDRQEVAGGEIPFNDSPDVQTRRLKGPRGLKGTHWQFKVSNVDGCRFNCQGLEPEMLVSSARTQ